MFWFTLMISSLLLSSFISFWLFSFSLSNSSSNSVSFEFSFCNWAISSLVYCLLDCFSTLVTNPDPPFLFDSASCSYKSLLLSKSTWLTWNVAAVNPALLIVDNIIADFYESFVMWSNISSYFSNWIISSSVIFVTIWSRLDIIFQSLRNPASYVSTPMYFMILKSSSYFYKHEAENWSHFFNVRTYDFCREELSAERIFLSLSSSLI